MKAKTKKEKNMEQVHYISQINQHIQDLFAIMILMEEAAISGQMVENMRETGLKIKCTEMVK